MRFADIDRELDQLRDEIGAEPPPLGKQSPISFEDADAALDALAKEAAVQAPLPPPRRLPTDPPLPTAASFADDTFAVSDDRSDDYESFAPPASSMPAGISSSEPPPLADEVTERSSIPETLGAYGAYPDVPPAPSIPSMDGIPHRPPSSIPPVATASFPSERPPPVPSERPSVSRSFAPPKFSDSSVPPPTAEEPAVQAVPEPPSQLDTRASLIDRAIGDSIADSEPPERPPEFAEVPSSVRPGREESTELIKLEDGDLVEMDLDEIEVDWDDEEAPTLQDSSEAISPEFALGDGLSTEATQRESVAEVSLSSHPPSLSAATGGSQPPDDNDWSDEFEDAFDIFLDPDDPER